MRKVLKLTLILFIIIIISWTAFEIYRENSIKQGTNTSNIQKIAYNEDKSEEAVQQKRNLNLVPEKYKGYNVIANLKIKKLNIDTCVLEKYSKKAMEICVTKFYGANPNEVGNFCIVGHNYITKNMFGYLYKLKIGDTFILTDNNNGVVKYKIYDMYRTEADKTYRTISKNKWQKGSNFNYML